MRNRNGVGRSGDVVYRVAVGVQTLMWAAGAFTRVALRRHLPTTPQPQGMATALASVAVSVVGVLLYLWSTRAGPHIARRRATVAGWACLHIGSVLALVVYAAFGATISFFAGAIALLGMHVASPASAAGAANVPSN